MKKMIISLLIVLNILSSYGQTGIITTVGGNGTAGFSGDGGAATAANLKYPHGEAIDASGNIYIADFNNYRIRKINTSGVISTVAGNGTAAFSGDGGPATAASIYNPEGLAVDSIGNLYIADCFNNRIRKVNTSGIISTVAGNGTAAFSGDSSAATAASLYYPFGVALDGSGNLYISDAYNHRIRKVNSAGIISTVAGDGTAAFSGDSSAATAASLNEPYGLAFDGSGNLYIADGINHRIRKVTPSGIIFTFAGNGIPAFAGDSSAATAASLNFPAGIAFDDSGNLYIADTYNNRIRKVNTSGIISTFAGIGTVGFSGDGGAATAAKLYGPEGLAFDGSGNLYITDRYNDRIRKVSVSAGSTHSPIYNAGYEKLNVYPNPTGGMVTIELRGYTGMMNINVMDVNGKVVIRKSCINNKIELNLGDRAKGIYLLNVAADGKQFTGEIVVE